MKGIYDLKELEHILSFNFAVNFSTEGANFECVLDKSFLIYSFV